jgi:archaellin
MAYTPNNYTIYAGAFAGALAGIEAYARSIISDTASDYADSASVAGTFAEAVDTAYAPSPANIIEIAAIQSIACGLFAGRSIASLSDITSIIDAMLTALDTYITSHVTLPIPVGTGSTGPTGATGGTGVTGSTGDTGPLLTPGGTLASIISDNGSDWTSRQLSLDDILPAFAISTFVCTTPSIEVGDTVAVPAFTASYATAPDTTPNSVVLTDNGGSSPIDVTATPTSFSSPNTYTPATYGASRTFTLTAEKSTITKTATSSITGLQKYFYGIGIAGQSSEAFIEALANSALTSTRSHTVTVTAGATDKIYYAYRAAYGIATFYIGGFEGGFNAPTTVSVTNAFGYTENYYLFESVQPNLGLTTVVAV